MKWNLTRRGRAWSWIALVAALATAVAMASCGSDGDSPTGGEGGRQIEPGDLTLSPQDQSITIDPEEELPTINFHLAQGDEPLDAEWSVDRRDLAQIDGEGVFTPTGDGAGVVTVTATVDGVEVTTTVAIKISTTQNGPGGSTPGSDPGTGTPADYVPGPGGFMGVGGEGIGGEIDDDLREVLEGSPEADPDMKFLYPYDGTVWPLGMLAPLLMWEGTDAEDAEAIMITLEGNGFEYRGVFGRPAKLASGAPFVRHPIPHDVWQRATRSAAGDTLTVSLVAARDGQAYGPITETWKIADGELMGCVYYQAYFTNFVDNEHEALGPDDRFGGATLGIRPGGTDPVLVAGWTSDDKSGCRVCHSVSADGSRMVVQHGDAYSSSSSIELQNAYEEETPYGNDGTLGWIGMTPDGSLGVGNSANLPSSVSVGPTALYDMETGQAIDSEGLTDFATHVGLPAFSHDGSMIAFNFWEGPGNDEIGSGDERKLVVMDFDQEARAFSNPRLMWEGDIRPGWPSFLPDGSGVVFQTEIQSRSEDESFDTRERGLGELWWAHIESAEAALLDRANGEEDGELYIPVTDDHPDDSIVNFEPTVSPISSGGYAWIVFMSRRQYGNVITAEPYASDPRTTDLTQAYSPKKLWIAAIDLGAAPGTDPSYPAIYLPAQEIQASNSRGFWTSDPCVLTGQM